jgi:hypothetical protein
MSSKKNGVGLLLVGHPQHQTGSSGSEQVLLSSEDWILAIPREFPNSGIVEEISTFQEWN